MPNKTKKDASTYLGASAIMAILDVIRNLLMASAFGPYLIGFFHTLLTVPQTAQYFTLGATKSLPIVIPYHKGRGNNEKIFQIKNSVINFSLIVSVISFISLLCYVPFSPYEGRNSILWFLCACSLIILWEIKSFFITDYATNGRFLRLSGTELTSSALVFIIQILGVPFLGGHAFWMGFIIPNIIIIIYSGRDYFRSNQFAFLKINFKELKKLFPLGVLLNFTSVTYNPFIITSRLFLAFTIGVTEVGYFLLATIVISKISIIPSAIGKVMLPKMSFLRGESNDIQKVFNLFLKTQIYTLGLTVIVVVIGLLCIESLTKLILPHYIQGLPAAKIILWGCLPYCLIDNANNFILALQKKRIYLYILLATFIVMITLFIVFSYYQIINATTVCISLSLTFLFYSLLANFFVVFTSNIRSQIKKKSDK